MNMNHDHNFGRPHQIIQCNFSMLSRSPRLTENYLNQHWNLFVENENLRERAFWSKIKTGLAHDF